MSTHNTMVRKLPNALAKPVAHTLSPFRQRATQPLTQLLGFYDLSVLNNHHRFFFFADRD
jgi:hypothetical protein